ncbi:MAG: M48 family metalloprotease [Gammaproteobacteria bacterium]|nr:M48 family metalloprotease [Gammaproteobacteria bacterium]MDH5214069.1 M48 family metalloprotease [Gammaproteobacteria bacterium]
MNRRLLSLGACAVLACASTPVLSQDIDHKIPPGYQPEEARDEQGLWMEIEDYELALNKSALLVRDPEINNYLQSVVCRVAGDYCNDIRVYLVRNPNFNASMTATGMMQIWTGLLVRASSTDELAAVIGHEIAHYTRLHTLERLRKLKASATAGSIFDIGLAVLTGYSSSIGQASAMLGVLAFSREQESEADFLGARLVAEAGLDPHASYKVWEKIIAEEAAAVAKRREPGMFAKTHPAAEDRAKELKAWVSTRYGPGDLEEGTDQALLDVLNNHYLFLMEDQIDTNRFGRSEELLQRHAAIGINPSLVRYFYGEMFRQRGEEGDTELAMAAYRHSIEGGSPPPEAYKNLGYLYLKTDNPVSAQESFREYLALAPDASDRAMIEFYLEDVPQ